jgi:phosphoglycolate phosphatase-like HAD superfamily hydrolase
MSVSAGKSAVIWDYDGTLVDSRRKNLSVNRAIIEEISGRPADSFGPLTSLECYDDAVARTANWREFYADEFGLSEVEIDRAGGLWGNYQNRDPTPIPVLAGVPEVLDRLSRLSHGIFSQNERDSISAVLRDSGLSHHFDVVVGFEEVGSKRQKPAPDGLLQCLEALTGMGPGQVFFVGDHETDAQCAANAREAIAGRYEGIEVISVGAFYCTERRRDWAIEPDEVALRPSEVAQIVERYAASNS